MAGVRRKNPLRKRLVRELKTEFAKYAVIFILLVSTIGLVSGFLVADNSMIIAYNEGFTKYNVEDGAFRLDGKMNRAQKKTIEAFGLQIFEKPYIEEAMQKGSTLRIYENRTQVNLACVMQGALPERPGASHKNKDRTPRRRTAPASAPDSAPPPTPGRGLFAFFSFSVPSLFSRKSFFLIIPAAHGHFNGEL